MPTPTKRSQPSTRDAEATKQRILDAAEDEFARAGLLGARTEAIAANTGVTKAMIHYYFKDKERLYQAVLERSLADRVRALQAVNLHNPDCTAALRQFLEAFLQNAARTENMAAIFLFEALQNKGKFYGQVAIATLYEPLVELLKRGMASGHFRKVDPLHAAVNIVGTCVFYYCANHNVRHLWPSGTDTMTSEMKAQHNQAAINMAVASIEAD